MRNILLLSGDGIGPEIANEALKVIDVLNKNFHTNFAVTSDYIGGAGYDYYGSPCDDKVLERARQSDAILLGAVGGPKWDDIPFEKKPERGLLRIRKVLDLFANLRPAICFDALADASSLKYDIVSSLDIIIVRELTSGVYFGEPRGISGPDGQRVAVDTQRYTEQEIIRIAHSAFRLAQKRSGFVTSCEKANVMQTGILWRNVVTDLHKKYYSDVKLSHMYADNAAMQLVRNPKQFDVILTDNLFGDVLSDIAAMLTGSLGMLPSASMGQKQGDYLPALYEPVHGSAPDIAGTKKANPIAMILSLAMMLRYSFSDHENADRIENAIKSVLKKGERTVDISGENTKTLSTSQMGDAIVTQIMAFV